MAKTTARTKQSLIKHNVLNNSTFGVGTNVLNTEINTFKCQMLRLPCRFFGMSKVSTHGT